MTSLTAYKMTPRPSVLARTSDPKKPDPYYLTTYYFYVPKFSLTQAYLVIECFANNKDQSGPEYAMLHISYIILNRGLFRFVSKARNIILR